MEPYLTYLGTPPGNIPYPLTEPTYLRKVSSYLIFFRNIARSVLQRACMEVL